MTLQIDHDRKQLVIDNSVGCLGIPVIVFSAIMLGGLVYAATTTPIDPLFLSAAAFLPVCGILAGVLIYRRRSEIVLNLAASEVDVRTRQFLRYQHCPHPLSNFEAVRLSRETTRTNQRSSYRYHVRLAGSADDLLLLSDVDDESARRDSETIARFLQLPLIDGSSGTETSRDPESLDASLQQRLGEVFSTAELPSAPADVRSRIDRTPDFLEIDIPPLGWSWRYFLGGAAGALIFAGIGGAVLSAIMDWPLPRVILIGGGVALLLVLGGVVASLHRAVGCSRLIVSRTGLTHARKSILGTWSVTIPSNELEELQVAARDSGMSHKDELHHGIIARSDSVTTRFGGEVSPSEQSYLVQVMKHWIANSQHS